MTIHEFMNCRAERDAEIDAFLNSVPPEELGDDVYSWMITLTLLGMEVCEDEMFIYRIRTRKLNKTDIDSGFFQNSDNLARIAENAAFVYSIIWFFEQNISDKTARRMMEDIERAMPSFFLQIYKKHHSDVIYLTRYFKSTGFLNWIKTRTLRDIRCADECIKAYTAAVEADLKDLNALRMFTA